MIVIDTKITDRHRKRRKDTEDSRGNSWAKRAHISVSFRLFLCLSVIHF